MTATTDIPTRPILRYHGGKWAMSEWILTEFPPHRMYVEPFGGAASVLLRKPRSKAEIYNDLDGEVVNLFRIARDRGEDLARALELTPYSRAEFELSYEASDDSLERARRMVVRSWMGHGMDGAVGPFRTGYRTNVVNRSQPAQEWANYAGAFRAIVARLRGVNIENRDAVEVMQGHDSETTLHYVDPPYVISTRTRGGRGYRHNLTDEQHRALAACLGSLKGAVVVSGYPSPLYDELFAGWTRLERQVIADKGQHRREVLWLRNCDRDLFTLNPAA